MIGYPLWIVLWCWVGLGNGWQDFAYTLQIRCRRASDGHTELPVLTIPSFQNFTIDAAENTYAMPAKSMLIVGSDCDKKQDQIMLQLITTRGIIVTSNSANWFVPHKCQSFLNPASTPILCSSWSSMPQPVISRCGCRASSSGC